MLDSPPITSWQSKAINRLENVYLAGFILLQLTTSIILPLSVTESTRARWEFMPLMATSVYCSVGLIWGWARLVYASVDSVKAYIRDGGKAKVS